MEKYLLDTNICIFYFKKKYNLTNRLLHVGFENCAISEITLAELIYGAECSSDVEQNMNIINTFIRKVKVIPILSALNIYAKEKSLLRKSGTLIDDLDIFIGATAIANDMILITDNEKHLKRLSNIKIENWIERKR
jgi:tRNA(fMet)-specific endonuclease VapC